MKSSQEEADSNLEMSSVTNVPRRSLWTVVAGGPFLVDLVLVLLARLTGLGCCELVGGACLTQVDLRSVGGSGRVAECWNVTGLGRGAPPSAGTRGSVCARLLTGQFM